MDASDYLLAQKSSPSSLDMAKVHIQFIFITISLSARQVWMLRKKFECSFSQDTQFQVLF